MNCKLPDCHDRRKKANTKLRPACIPISVSEAITGEYPMLCWVGFEEDAFDSL